MQHWTGDDQGSILPGMTAPAWQLDPDDPHLLRWHDGSQFTDARKPRMIAAAEDQVQLLAEIRDLAKSTKDLVMVIAVLAIVGSLGTIFAVIATHRG